jgi:hypothetical protein
VDEKAVAAFDGDGEAMSLDLVSSVPCPGCGAPMSFLEFGTDVDGVSKLNEYTPGFVTFRRKETARLLCHNGCHVRITRESPELTSKQLDSLPAMPLIEEARQLCAAEKRKR